MPQLMARRKARKRNFARRRSSISFSPTTYSPALPANDSRDEHSKQRRVPELDVHQRQPDVALRVPDVQQVRAPTSAPFHEHRFTVSP